MPTTTLSNPRTGVSISASLAVGATGAALLSGTINHAPTNQTPTVGNSAGNVNKIYANQITLATGTTTTLDLTALTDPAGGTVSLVHVNHFLIENLSTATAEIITAGGGTNGLVDTITLPIAANGGKLFYEAPNPGITVDSTHKLLRLDVASGTAVLVNVTILGRNA